MVKLKTIKFILISLLGLCLSSLAHADMREVYEKELAASQDMTKSAEVRRVHKQLAEGYLERAKEDEANRPKPVVLRENKQDCTDSNFSGTCDYTYSGGDRYIGEWVNGKQYGYGVYTHPNGYRYEGGWRNNRVQGRGLEILADGTRYEGNFENGNLQGRGTYIQSDGLRYEGDWRDGKMHGRGVISESYGYRYEGDFRDDKKHGQGTINYGNGSRYEGSMANGKENGYGTHINPNGERLQGEFVNGTLNGSATITLANGERHQVECHNEKCEYEDERSSRRESYQRYDSGYSSPPIQLPSRSNDDFILQGAH